jgi:hypothetical protein
MKIQNDGRSLLHRALHWTANAANYYLTYRKHIADIASCTWMETSDQLYVPEIFTPGEPFGSHETGD